MNLTVPATPSNCRALFAFNLHKGGAAKRGIPFLFTFAEWEWLWLRSGKWDQRGHSGNQYCMARRGPDKGPYAVWNVDIKTREENLAEAIWAPWSEERRKAWSEFQKGKPKSAETRKRMSEASKRRGAKPPTRWKSVEVHGVVYSSMAEAAASQGIQVPALRKRIQSGWEGHLYL